MKSSLPTQLGCYVSAANSGDIDEAEYTLSDSKATISNRLLQADRAKAARIAELEAEVKALKEKNAALEMAIDIRRGSQDGGLNGLAF